MQDKVNRLLDIQEQYEIVSPVKKKNNQKETHSAKGESFKIVQDARYLNSLIDESKCNGL